MLEKQTRIGSELLVLKGQCNVVMGMGRAYSCGGELTRARFTESDPEEENDDFRFTSAAVLAVLSVRAVVAVSAALVAIPVEAGPGFRNSFGRLSLDTLGAG